MENTIIRTTECERFGHPEFKLTFDPVRVIHPDVTWMIEFLSKHVASGTRYQPGELVQIGWMILKVEANSDSSLSLLEPDFFEMPIRFVDSVTQTLVHLRLQKSVAESIGLEALIAVPSLLQSCLICTRIKDRGDFMMERFEASNNDSGWYIGCVDADHNHNDPKNLRRVSLYDIARGLLSCVPFLALPPTTKLILRSDRTELAFGGRTLVPKENSFLQQYSCKKTSK